MGNKLSNHGEFESASRATALYSPPLVQGDDEENSGPKYEYIGEKHPEDPTQQHGKGKAIYANGDEFEGTYVQGKRDGPGVYQWIKMVMDEEEGVEKPAQDDEGNKVFQSKYEGTYKDNMKVAGNLISVTVMARTGIQTGTSTQESGDLAASTAGAHSLTRIPGQNL